MSAELTQDPHAPTQVEREFPFPPSDLPYDDGEPLETNRHRIAMNVLIDSVYAALADRDDFFAGGNMFVYYSVDQAMNRDFRGPDFFITLGVDGSKERKYWAIWDEQGRYPDAIVELMSSSTRQVDLVTKKQLYAETFHTREYFVYDPFDADSLQGWRLDADGEYQALTKNEQGWLWCQKVGLWLGTWSGKMVNETAPWLRFYAADRNLVLLPAEQERERAEQERERAEQERERAEQERQERERAQQERDRARQEAEQERQARLEAISRLLALGLSSADIAAALALPVAAIEQVRAAQDC